MPVRICSLLPSATEMVGALGLLDSLVGVSAECDFPAAARGKPVVTGARVDTSTLGSLAIDAAVGEALQEGRSLYAIDEELIRGLAPDLILTQDLCTVCAVSSGEVALCGIEAETLVLDAHTIAEIGDCMLALGARLGVPERAAEVVRVMREKVAGVEVAVAAAGAASEVAGAGGAPGRRPRVFVAEWLEPPFAAGHWVPEMVAAAGGVEVLGRAGQPAFATTWDAVRAAQPDLGVRAP